MNEGKVNPQAIALRQAFEDWYTLNAFDLSANPIGSRECHLQWQAWQAASRATPEPSVAAEACKHPAEKTRSIHYGREGFAHWCQACGSFRPGEGCKWIAPAAHPGIVPGWVQMSAAIAAAEYAWQHDDWDWSAVEEGLRSRLEDRDWCLSCELAAAPKDQPARFHR